MGAAGVPQIGGLFNEPDGSTTPKTGMGEFVLFMQRTPRTSGRIYGRIYGLDIVIDPGDDEAGTPPERRNGYRTEEGDDRFLDPARCVISAAAISTVDSDECYDGDERRILSMLDQRFAVLPAGVISTWNGSILDLPFLRARALVHGIDLGLRLISDDRRHRHPAMGNGVRHVQIGDGVFGAARPVCGAWHDQRHVDLSRIYRGNESVATAGRTDELLGLDPRRGAHLARSLAERRWSRARRHIDRMPAQPELHSYTWTCMSPEFSDGPPVRVLSGG